MSAVLRPECTIIHHKNPNDSDAPQASKHQRSQTTQQTLRLSLAKKLQCSPELIQFEIGAFGKKQLTASTLTLCQHILHHPLHFSISHSGSLSAFVLASQPVGLDLEDLSSRSKQLSRPLQKKLITCTSTHSRQQALRWQQFMQLCPQHQQQLSLRLWTLLEAITKIHGNSLWHRFQQGFPLSQKTWHTLSHHHSTTPLTFTTAGYQAYLYCLNHHTSQQLTLTALTGSPTTLTGSPTALTGSPTALTDAPTALTGSPTALTGYPKKNLPPSIRQILTHSPDKID